MADWKEIERLQADFQRTQLSVTTQRLSERNCIEILMKLQEMKLINVLHSSDGKEYLTPKQLTREIKDELFLHGGRINLVNLQQTLHIDFSHIEEKVNDLVEADKNLQLCCGQLIESSYLDQLAEDINDSLQASGQVTVAELSKTFDLPGEFLLPEIILRMGRIIKGKIDEQNKDTIYTAAYLAKHKARIRGILTAVTQPLPINFLLTRQELPLDILFVIIEELLHEGRVKGQIVGGRSEKSTFTPSIYTQTQNLWIDTFYKQNNYLEFDAVARLGIKDAKFYLKKRFGDGNEAPLFLNTLCVGKIVRDQIVAVVDEVISTAEWSDVMALLPSSFSPSDGNQLLQLALQERRNRKFQEEDALVFADTIVASQVFVNSCTKHFDSIITERAEKEAKKSSVLALTEEERKEYLNLSSTDVTKKGEKKDERRRKAQEGSGSVKRVAEFGGSGMGAREVKTKGKDKKRLKWKKEQEQSNESATSKNRREEPNFMTIDEIDDVLQERLTECPDDFIRAIAEKIHKPLVEQFQLAVKSVFLLAKRQVVKKDADSKESENTSANNPRKSRKKFEEDINGMWATARLFSEAFKYFNDDVSAQLQKHLLQTTCTHLTSLLFFIAANEFVPDMVVDEQMSSEVRIKLLSKLPPNIKSSLNRLNNSLKGKSFVEFTNYLKDATSPAVCDVMLKQPDKKKDRQTLHGHKMTQLKLLETESDPASCLHLTVLIIFQSVTGAMLNAPGKLVPTIIQTLQEHVERAVSVDLLQYEEMVMKQVRLKKNADGVEELVHVEEQLSNEIEKIKRLASVTKKRNIS